MFNSLDTIIFDSSIQARKYARFNKPVLILPLGLETLILGYHFTQHINLSKNLRVVHFGDKYNRGTMLPKAINKVSFGAWFNSKVILSKGVRSVRFGFCFDQMIQLPKWMKHVSFENVFKQRVVIPKNVIVLKIDNCFEQNYGQGLSKRLRILELGHRFNERIVLPQNMRFLKWDNWTHVEVPESLVELKMDDPDIFIINQITSGLKKITHCSNKKLPRGYLPNNVIVEHVYDGARVYDDTHV